MSAPNPHQRGPLPRWREFLAATGGLVSVCPWFRGIRGCARAPRALPGWPRSLSLGAVRRFALCVAGLFVLAGCGLGENTVVNPEGNRAPQVLPDTLRGLVPSADRTFRPILFTGTSAVLAVATDGQLRSTAYLRFVPDALPDTVAVASGELHLYITDHRGGPFRFELLELAASAGQWDEDTLSDEEFAVVEPALDASTLIDPADGDTTVVFDVPGALIRSWKNRPETNNGVAVRMVAADGEGSIRFHSSESAATGLRPSLEVLRAGEVSIFEIADEDGYVLIDESPAQDGEAVELLLQEESPWRALFRFDTDTFGLRPGDAINRAVFTVFPVPGSMAVTDSFEVGVYEAIGDWEEGAEPDSVGRSTVALDIVEVRTSSDSLQFDIAPLVQRWLDGEENFGFHMRILTEGRGDAAVRVHSSEAAAPVRPHLTLVYTEPPGPRWEGPSAARAPANAAPEEGTHPEAANEPPPAGSAKTGVESP